MKTIGKSLLLSLVFSLAIMAYLNMDRLSSTRDDLHTFEVAAGAVSISDPTSPDPLLHCYPVATADELDIRTRMDFEARSSGGWVAAPERSEPGQFCLIETPAAVEKRLAEPPTP